MSSARTYVSPRPDVAREPCSYLARRFSLDKFGQDVRTTPSSEDPELLRLLFRIVTVVSVVKAIMHFVGRRREGGH
ncbi:MAG: hypothetical protein M3N13_11045 [Candidatus Eremiobacteraeota bacterium]|nr:hypothetical protein [Candidatus Eremiobacteraeota bacterium]